MTQPQGGGTHFNGMPGGVINPTIDGVNNSSNGFKSGGTSFFGTVRARLGAMEEVTVESAGLDAESGAQGGVNLKFVTKRGTNQYHGTVFEQFRNDTLNANTYIEHVARHSPSRSSAATISVGTSVVHWCRRGKWRDKLFLFINYEQEYIPQTSNVTRTVLTDEATAGDVPVPDRGWRAADRQPAPDRRGRTVSPSTMDPTLMALFARQRSSYGAGIAQQHEQPPQRSQLIWEAPQKQINYYPTARLDYQITPTLSWMGSWNLYRQDNDGRQYWPLPGQPAAGAVHGLVVDHLDGTELGDQLGTTHNELSYGVQHSGDTTPGRELRELRAQRHRQRSAGAVHTCHWDSRRTR